MKFVRFGVPVLLVVMALGAGIFIGSGGLSVAPKVLPETVTESRSTQIIQAVTREEQVVLLGLGIQGIDVKKAHSKTWWGEVLPGSERKMLLQYSFTAKIGIEGNDVDIVKVAEDHFIVSIPEFVFIGHDDEHFESAIESNGVLSWVTEEIDPITAVNNILGDENKQEYLEQHAESLQEQARAFYEGLVLSIDPGVVVEFEFA